MITDFKNSAASLAVVFWFLLVTTASVWFLYEKVSLARYRDLVRGIQEAFQRIKQEDAGRFQNLSKEIEELKKQVQNSREDLMKFVSNGVTVPTKAEEKKEKT